MDLAQFKLPLLFLGAALLLGGASYYATDVVQAEKAQQLRDSRRVAALAEARVEDLLAQEAVSEEAAAAALSRWHSRYKYIPNEMDTADIVEYLESLTRNGFDSFDLRLAGRTDAPDYGKYTFEIKGMGRYSALYHLVWHLENNREFYRIDALRMSYKDTYGEQGEGPPPIGRDLVEFSFQVDAFFSDMQGISAPEQDLAPLPVGLLLPHNASRDVFRPIVRVPKDAPTTSVAPPQLAGGGGAAAPSPSPSPSPAATAPPAAATAPSGGRAPAEAPRPDGLDIARSRLTLILGDQARFTDEWGRDFTVRVGDDVENGEIVIIDARNAAVHARITERGRERIVVRTLGDGIGD